VCDCVTRRSLVVALATLGGIPAARADVARAFLLETADGAVIRNFAIPKALAPTDLPGVLVAGAAKAAPVLYAFLDYACSFCRLASQELDLQLGPASGLRLGLLHHPVLGAGSQEAALVVIAARPLFGDSAALRLHMRLFEAPGRVGAEKALALAASMGLDPEQLKAETQSARTRAVLDTQSGRAVALGLLQTPAFVFGDYAFVGWPGTPMVRAFAEALKTCGGLACAPSER